MLFRLLFIIISLSYVASSQLNCTFNEQCCWFSHNGITPWKIIRTRLENIDYRRIFRTEKFKAPPMGNFITLTMESNEESSAKWTSCPFCSQSGLITIRLRAWQSPTAHLILCWRFAEGTEVQSTKCASIHRWLQSGTYTINRFAVPRQRHLQFYLQMVRNESHSKATVAVDRIFVETVLCTRTRITQQQQPRSSSTKPPPSPPPSVPPQASRSSQRYSTIARQSTRPPANSAINPLYEIFGKEFAEFLREDLDTTKQDRAELAAAEQTRQMNNAVQQQQPTEKPTDLISELLSGKLLRIEPLVCNTVGGCLFDRSMCTYQNSNLAHKASFRMASVLNQRFVQALVPPGGRAILEVKTRFPEDHMVLFDLLEFTEGETLSVCCLKSQNGPQELTCPYITEPQSTPVLWRSEKIVCPVGTTMLMFICENSGVLDGSCSIDNVRLHKMNDILQLEPCQKDLLLST